MNRPWPIALVVIAAASYASADPAPIAMSPWGGSPYVVPYRPPPVESREHRGLTLEIAAGGGSTSLDASAGGVTFAIGVWLAHDVALAFRVTDVGAVGFVGGSVQYYATATIWGGAGLGQSSERGMGEFGGTTRTNGTGGFVRAGYNLAQSGSHALYVSGEIQAGSIEGVARAVGLVAIGYQLL